MCTRVGDTLGITHAREKTMVQNVIDNKNVTKEERLHFYHPRDLRKLMRAKKAEESNEQEKLKRI